MIVTKTCSLSTLMDFRFVCRFCFNLSYFSYKNKEKDAFHLHEIIHYNAVSVIYCVIINQGYKRNDCSLRTQLFLQLFSLYKLYFSQTFEKKKTSIWRTLIVQAKSDQSLLTDVILSPSWRHPYCEMHRPVDILYVWAPKFEADLPIWSHLLTIFLRVYLT